jgi:hypothetical protein
MTEEQDDLTLVYMWAFKQGQKSAEKRVEQLKNLLEERDAFIVKNNLWQEFVAALEERKDG